MTTLTVEINKDKGLSALKDFIDHLGLSYKINKKNGLTYSDDVKELLDKRYLEYKSNSVQMLSQDESKNSIQKILS